LSQSVGIDENNRQAAWLTTSTGGSGSNK